MSREQSEAIEHLLRTGPLDLGGDLAEQRPLLEALMTSHPLPAGVTTAAGTLGGVPVLDVVPSGASARGVLLYFHGGAYALGSAFAGAGLVAELATRTACRGISVEYRLAPEHPYPAALEDAVVTYRALLNTGAECSEIVVAGESAGGGLALALLQRIRDENLPIPAAGVLLSPWADLTVTSGTISSHADVDSALSPRALRIRAADYAGDAAPDDRRVSPLYHSFGGLPPLLVQAGTHEILLDDAIGIAAAAARAHVNVALEVTADVPHVFQGFAADLDEASTALDAAAEFIMTRLSTHHYSSALAR